MPAIFISYRKEDTPGAAAHLYKNLSETFGPGTVYMDVARSQPGRDVRQVVEEHLDSTLVVLVIIGKEWAGATDDTGQRKLDNPGDVVRIETAAALKRSIPVIPLLVQGAGMVQPAELPPELGDLAFRNPVTLLQSQWGSDVETLVTLLQSLVHGQLPAAGAAKAPAAGGAADARHASAAATARERNGHAPAPRSSLGLWAAAATAVAVVAVAFGIYTFMQPSPPPLADAVAQAQLAAAAALAKAESAKAELQAAQALADKNQAARDAARAAAPKPEAADQRALAEKAKADAAEAQAAEKKAAEVKAVQEKVAQEKAAEQRAAEQAAAEQRDAEKKAVAQKALEQKALEQKAEEQKAEEQKAAALKAAEKTAAEKTAAQAPPTPAAAPTAPTERPTLPPLASKTARALTFPKWTLKSGGCGSGPLTIVGIARFTIDKTSDGVVVTEEFRGSGNGFDVVVSGQVEYREERPTYDVPTTGQWTSPNKSFKTTGTDRLNTGGDGVTPRSANVVTFQSLCG